MKAVWLGFACLACFASTTLSQLYCPMEWEPFQQSCYKFIVYPEKDYNEATIECVRHHSALVSVNTLAEHDFIEQRISQMSALKSSWYTSGNLLPDGSFGWNGDGTTVDMNPNSGYWLSGQVDTNQRTQRYIIYAYENAEYGWKLSDPSAKLGFICETPLVEVYKALQDEREIDYGMDFMPSLSDVERGPFFLLDAQDKVIIGNPPTAYIECVATGKPAPTYIWRNGTIKDVVIRDGMELNSRINSRYTLTNGGLTFYKPARQFDAAHYQCKASNKYGTIISQPIQVSFGRLGEFTNVGVSAVQAYTYNGAQLECPKIDFEPAIRYQWAKDKPTLFVRPENQEYLFISNNGKLYFSEVYGPDDGYYYCVVTLSRPSTTSQSYSRSFQTPSATAIKMKLNVADPVGGQNKPEILDEFISIFPTNPKRGDTVKLECFAYGTLPLQYTWRRIGRKKMPVKSRTLDHNRVLEIEDVSEKDGGKYECEVYSSKTRQGHKKQFTLNIQSKPYFRVPLKDQLVDKGSQLTWRCYASASPPETYFWFKNGELITPIAGEIEIRRNTLVINNLDKNKHDGMYQCAAKNQYGISFSSAQLRVLEFAPTFKKQATIGTTYATLGGNASVECTPEAAPFPTFKWFKNGVEMSVSIGDTTSRVRMIPGGDLLITDVQYADQGEYRCEATNGLGSGDISGRLAVLQSTTINRGPSPRTVRVNETAFLYCRASYNPILDMVYIWWFNGVPVDVDKNPYYSWGSGDDQGGLYIRNAQFEHEGEYTCVARTQGDEIKKSAFITVNGPPGEPAGVFAIGTTRTNTSMRIKWTMGDDHGDPIQHYLIEAATNFENFTVWRVLKKDVFDNNAIDQTDLDAARRTTVLTSLTPGTGYKFRVRATNRYGLGMHSPPSEVYHTLDDRPTKAVEEVGGGGGKVGDITITWKPLAPVDHHGPGIGYMVYWRKRGTRVTEVDWEKGVLYGNASRFVHTVGVANYYMEYEVKVQAFNSMGNGQNSSIQVIYSAEDLPIATIGTPNGEGFNATCLRIFWTPVEDNRVQIKGKLLGYKINYWMLDQEKEAEAKQAILHGQRDGGLIIGLEPDTFYQFNVQVYNTAGNGPKSETFRQTTFHYPPLHYPTEVKILSISSDTVELRWRGVSTQQGEEPLQGYKIRYWISGMDIRNATDIDTGRTSEGRITGLRKNILYTLRVLAYSRGGDGKMSMPPLAFTMEYGQIRYDETQTDFLATGSQIIPSFIITFVSLLFIVYFLH